MHPHQGAPVTQWIDDDGEPIEPLGEPEPVDPAEVIRKVSQWCSHQVESAREVEAIPGPRLAQTTVQPQRITSSEDVFAAIVLSPAVASARARRGAVFNPPLRGLSVEIDSLETNGPSCSWRATVRTRLNRKRTATLRIDPSPSGVLTMLRLVPTSVPRFRTRSFITTGVPAIRELSERLERGGT